MFKADSLQEGISMSDSNDDCVIMGNLVKVITVLVVVTLLLIVLANMAA